MEGRHATLLMANAADLGGKFVQAWDDYADLPDRVGVPLRKYVRLSDEEIEMRFVYVNNNPVLVVIMDDTIVKGLNILRGMPQGGSLVVNTKRTPDEILAFIPNKEILANIVCVDASGIASDAAIDFMGSEGGVEVASVGAGISAPLVGAAAKVCDRFTVENVVKVAANKDGVQKGFDTAQVKAL
jgi:oxalate oxidoreductase subunit delta